MATNNGIVVFSRVELNLIAQFAACSLDESPGKNWVENAPGGAGLPDYICSLAKAIRKTGKTTSQAIAIAISRCKKWAAGGEDVDAATRAKAAKAVAEWEALKAKNAGKKKVKATGQGDILCLSDAVSVFNVDKVRLAWNQQAYGWRRSYEQAYPDGGAEAPPPYSYIKEMWTDHLIVCAEIGALGGPAGHGESEALFRVDYQVNSNAEVTFGTPMPVTTAYVSIAERDMVGRQMSNSELRQMLATHTAAEKVLLAGRTRVSALDRVLVAQAPPSALSRVITAPRSPTTLSMVLSARRKPSADQEFLDLIHKRA